MTETPKELKIRRFVESSTEAPKELKIRKCEQSEHFRYIKLYLTYYKKYGDENIKSIILAGGSGTRLWPLSRELYPKQFLKIYETSLFQDTFIRCLEISDLEAIFVVTTEAQKLFVNGQIEELGYEIPKKNILVEPEGKNTLPAICFGMREIEKRFGRSVVGIFSSDHMLDINAMDTIARSEKLADDHLVTFGIVPTIPHTGYGYIKPGTTHGSGYIVAEFKEKPDIETAKQYIKKGYMWNSGMFLFDTQLFFAELQLHAPQLWNEFCVPGKYIEDIYNTVPNISVDYGILEKSNKVAVVKLIYKWSDLGNFDAMYQEFEKDEKGNIVHNCDDLSVDSTGNLIYSTRKKAVSLIDINDTIVIDTRDALMVCPRRSSQKVKKVVTILKKQGDERITLHRTVYKPWGSHTTLERSPGHRIRRLSIISHKTIGTQSHDHRTEHWVVIKGTASVTIGDNESILEQGESTFIHKGVKHKIFNPGSNYLEIIEVQLGKYVGDDDITRYE